MPFIYVLLKRQYAFDGRVKKIGIPELIGMILMPTIYKHENKAWLFFSVSVCFRGPVKTLFTPTCSCQK